MPDGFFAPKASEILGRRSHADAKGRPADADLAVLVIPPQSCLPAPEACAAPRTRVVGPNGRTLAADPETRAMVRYAEDVENGQRFVEVARTASRRTPLIVAKSGRTTAEPFRTFGQGGICAEVSKDVACPVAPIGPDDAEATIREIRSFPLLRGVRGATSPDLTAVADALGCLFQPCTDAPDIVELDVHLLPARLDGAAPWPGMPGSRRQRGRVSDVCA